MTSNALLLSFLALAEQPDPLEHVVNHPAIRHSSGYWLWSGNQGALVLSGLIVILVGLWVAKRVKTGPAGEGADAYVTKNRFAHFIEVVCVYLREEALRPLLGDRTERYTPVMLAFFFFILVNNLMGLAPIRDLLHVLGMRDWVGGTATQNIWVTGALALISGVLFNIAALLRLGPHGFFKHMMGGLPWAMLPIALLLLTIETFGQFVIKPFALALRLFANMTGGHVLIATLLGFAGAAVASALDGGGWGENGAITLISVVSAIALTFLELLVAVLQAFVFMFLTALFISIMDHHEEHGHEHGHDHADGHEHAHA